MKRIWKKLVVTALSVMLIGMMAVPVQAIVIESGDVADYIYGWCEITTTPAILAGHGTGNNITVGTNQTTGNHVWYVDANSGGYLIRDGSRSYCVNIHRVLQSGIYYPCTGYVYENATGGRDQRVQLIQMNGYTLIKILNPIVGGNWYMMADYSSPVSNSNVIWYTTESAAKAHWG